MQRDPATLLDILNAARLAREFPAGMDYAAFLSERKSGKLCKMTCRASFRCWQAMSPTVANRRHGATVRARTLSVGRNHT